MPCMCDLLYSGGSHCICELFFLNYPILSRCTKFVFQKRCELEVIYILFLPWPKEDFASENSRGRSTESVSRKVEKVSQNV